MKGWRVVFATVASHHTVPLASGADSVKGRREVQETFAAHMAVALRRGGCRQFTVTVHPDETCEHDDEGDHGHAGDAA